MGCIEENLCPICITAPGSINHIYFNCPFSSKCLEGVSDDVVRYSYPNTKFAKSEHETQMSYEENSGFDNCNSLIYAIWRARNKVIWNFRLQRVDSVIRNIKEETIL